MEGSFQGDLADVVRASGGEIDARVSDFQVDQVPLTSSLNVCEGFGDPFSSLRDPLPVELEGIGRHGFHGDHLSGFQISCTSDNKSVNCDGLMNPSSPKGSSSFVDTTRVQISSPRNPILKRRKSQAKKVVCIPAPTAVNTRQGGGEVVPSDLWAWRKYGQKPIKGSPYPRGYYRCSSSKGCLARKQVERSRTDPNMLVITYTSDHNHPWPTQRNSLAGSSRIPTAATSSSSNPPATTVKPEPDPQPDPPSGSPDHHDVTVPSHQLMASNELVFDYHPVMQEELTDPHDFFAELRELEEVPDPLSLLAGNKSMLDVDVDDPFGSLFDWSTSNATATTNRENSR